MTCLAQTQGPKIRVNAVLPGLLLTEWVRLSPSLPYTALLLSPFQVFPANKHFRAAQGQNLGEAKIRGSREGSALKQDVSFLFPSALFWVGLGGV